TGPTGSRIPRLQPPRPTAIIDRASASLRARRRGADEPSFEPLGSTNPRPTERLAATFKQPLTSANRRGNTGPTRSRKWLVELRGIEPLTSAVRLRTAVTICTTAPAFGS